MTRRNKLIQRLAQEAEQDARLIAHQAQQIRDLKRRLVKVAKRRDEWHRAARYVGAKLDAVKERGK